MSGRKRSIVWLDFDEIKNESRKGSRAKCKNCGKEIEGQIVRMSNHLSLCKRNDFEEDDSCTISSSQSTVHSKENDSATPITADFTSSTEELKSINHPAKKIKSNKSLDSYVVKTSTNHKTALDEQVARFIYATNTSFRSVEHPQFVKMVQLLRPGYVPPNRKDIAGPLLDSIYEKEKLACATILKNENVCLGFDGWSNIHNEPVICVTVTTKVGETYLIDTIDTSSTSHTAENLEEIALATIQKCQVDLQCSIGSVVTDNAKNVKKMRDMLDENETLNAITYGCSAHVLNLLAKDIHYPTVKEQLLQILKYFRNNHFANGCYRSHAKAPKLILPNDTRWNSVSDALDVYIKSWPILLKICEENRQQIDKNIQNLVSNLHLKRNAEDMLEKMKPISIALDKAQKNNCTIADAVCIWKELKRDFTEKKVDKNVMEKLNSRYKMALTPAHFLAFLLDPREKQGLKLSDNEKDDALKYAQEKYPGNLLLPLIVKFGAKTSPFKKSLFEPSVVSAVTPYEWWKSQEDDICKFNDKVFHEIEPLLTAKASTASVERMFSTFGLVQSKLRNKLSLEKASKLVFLFKIFN